MTPSILVHLLGLYLHFGGALEAVALVCSEAPDGAWIGRMVMPEDGTIDDPPPPTEDVCIERWLPELRRGLRLGEDAMDPADGPRLEELRRAGPGWSAPRRISGASALRRVRLAPGRIDYGGGRAVFSAVDDSGDRDIWILHGRTGRVQRLTRTPAVDDGAVVDLGGRAVYFTSDREGSVDVWRWRIGAEEVERMTNGDGREFLPVAAGDSLFFLRETTAARELVLTVDGRERVLDASVRAEAPALSPDGRYLCWTADRGGDADVRVLDFEQGAPAFPVPAPARDGSCRWDPVVPGRLWFESERTGDVEVFHWTAATNALVNATRSPGRDRLTGFWVRR